MDVKTSKVSKKSFPEGFFVLLGVIFFYMAAFSIVQSLLVLYTVKAFNFSDQSAYLLYATFISLVFTTPILGGYVGNRHLGYPLSLTIGLGLSTAGLYLTCFNTLPYFYVGLATFIIGSGTSLANLFVLIGRLFDSRDYRREAGFTLCYGFMNLGAIITLVASGYIVTNWNFQSAFLIAAVCMLIALLTFILGIKTFILEHVRNIREKIVPIQRFWHHPMLGVFILIAAIPVISELLYFTHISDKVLAIVAILAVSFMIHHTRKVPQNQRAKLHVFLIILAISLAFWSLYMLAPSVLTLFIARNVDRTVGGFSIPPSDFYALNPLYTFFLGGLFSALWLYLQKRKRSPSLPIKFAIGVGLIGATYLLLSLSTHFTGSNGLISAGWIAAAYLLQTLGEIFVSPIGAAMVGQLVPANYEGVMMGMWLLTIGLGGSFSGYLAETTISKNHLTQPLATNTHYARSFLEFGIMALSVAFLTLIITPLLKRKLRGEASTTAMISGDYASH